MMTQCHYPLVQQRMYELCMDLHVLYIVKSYSIHISVRQDCIVKCVLCMQYTMTTLYKSFPQLSVLYSHI